MKECLLKCEAQHEGVCCSDHLWGVDISEGCAAKTNDELLDKDEYCELCKNTSTEPVECKNCNINYAII